MRYILDLSGVHPVPEWLGDLRELPVQDGKFFMDYDVIEEELSPDDLERIREVGRRKFVRKYGPERAEACEHMPIGFDFDNLPQGAILREVSDG